MLRSAENTSLHLICCFYIKPNTIQHISLLTKSHLGKEIQHKSASLEVITDCTSRQLRPIKECSESDLSVHFLRLTEAFIALSLSLSSSRSLGTLLFDLSSSLHFWRHKASLMKDLLSLLLLTACRIWISKCADQPGTTWKGGGHMFWQWLFRSCTIAGLKRPIWCIIWTTHNNYKHYRCFPNQLYRFTFWASPDRSGFENDVEFESVWDSSFNFEAGMKMIKKFSF